MPAREFRDCAVCPVMVGIPAGSFTMGSPPGERGRFDAEGPQHGVSVRAFALGKYDITNEEFLIFLRETEYRPAPCDPILGLTWESPGRGLAYPPGHISPPRWPAVCLSWHDARAYIAWLNGKVRARAALAAAPSACPAKPNGNTQRAPVPAPPAGGARRSARATPTATAAGAAGTARR